MVIQARDVRRSIRRVLARVSALALTRPAADLSR